jgi:catechol 2,3-dioxygenase-like lactoylglutathione lyase family enzyme
MAELGLIVLRAADAARTRRFYETIGLHFAAEQHEMGVLHYACQLGALVLEIYPGKSAPHPDANSAGAAMLGLRVADVDQVHAALLAAGAKSRRAPADSPFGRRAVVEDPDGRVVELTGSLLE